jgi:hypothetical protein
MSEHDQPENATTLQLDGDEPVEWVPAPGGCRMVPVDWQDAAAVIRRTERLVAYAHHAAEALVEMLLRVPEDQRSGRDPLRGDGYVVASSEALFALECARHKYVNETLRYDGPTLIDDAVGRSHGRAVAMLTQKGLEAVRDAVERMSWEKATPGPHTDVAWEEYKAEGDRLRRELDARAAARRAAKARREGRLPR